MRLQRLLAVWKLRSSTLPRRGPGAFVVRPSGVERSISRLLNVSSIM